MSDAAFSTDIPGDSWQKTHEKARGVTAQDPGKAIERMHAHNAEVRRIEAAKKAANAASKPAPPRAN
jgi:hypothetical protein